MSDKIVLSAEKRTATGKKVRALRRDGKVPATVYEKGKESFNIEMEYIPFSKVWAAAGTGQPVEITVGKETHLTMIKDVAIDPAKNTILHAAFHAVNKNDPVEAEVPVHIEGDVPAEQQGNFIVRPNDHVLVKALPANLPEAMNVSAEKLIDPGDSVTVADITPVADVEILAEPELPLAIVEEPKAGEEESEETEEVDAADVPSDNGGEQDEDSSDSEEKSE